MDASGDPASETLVNNFWPVTANDAGISLARTADSPAIQLKLNAASCQLQPEVNEGTITLVLDQACFALTIGNADICYRRDSQRQRGS